jgi:hypothetical protein
MSIPTTLCIFSSEVSQTSIRYDFGAMFRDLAERDEADAVIVSTEEGFSPLGASREFFERDLGIPYDAEIRQLARWNQDENEKVSIIALKSKNAQGLLRGVLLTPGENCLSYAPFDSTSQAYSPKPHRDYYYNVSYEAIAFLCQEWGARKIAISHLSASGRFHEDIATCHVEALMHFCNEHPDLAPESFTFCGCCIEPNQLAGAQRLVEANEIAPHRQIRTSARIQGPAKIITLDWSANQSN